MMEEDMYHVDLEDDDNSEFKSGSDSFEKDFDDIRSETACELKHLKKIQVSEPSVSGKEATFTITTVFQPKNASEEQLKKVNRKYSEFQWLHNQLQKSFPGCLIPSLPTMYDVKKAFTIKSTKGQEASETAKQLKYTLNNYVTLSNYAAQVLGNDRFKNFVKLKEFITNPEQIKNIPSMDHDDPIVHNKIFKFIKSKGKSILGYAWGSETKKSQPSVELKGKGEEIQASNEKSVAEMEDILKTVKDNVCMQIKNLTELWTHIETFIRQISEDKEKYTHMAEAFEDIKEWESKNTLRELYGKMSNVTNDLKSYQNDLAAHVKTSVLIDSKKILAKYQWADRAIDRLLDLSIDVEDLKSMIQKYKEEPEIQETYKSEHQHYLNLLRNNFDALREDSAKMQNKEEKNLKKVVQEFYKAQVMFFEQQQQQWGKVNVGSDD